MPIAERALLGFAAVVDGLHGKAGVLVLDEPTASLPPGAAQLLFDAIQRLRVSGSAVLFISHQLDEITEISTRVSVLRDGRLVGTVDTAATSEDELVRLMLGRDLGELYPDRKEDTVASRKIVLDASGVSGRIIRDMELQVGAGEIVGVTGLVGMGQDELPYLLYGALPIRSRIISVNSQMLRSVNPTKLRAQGVALVPADRSRSGALAASISENLSLPFRDGGGVR